MKVICVLFLLLFLMTACDLIDSEQPVVVPAVSTVSSSPESDSARDSSPRSVPDDSLPPTWTPISDPGALPSVSSDPSESGVAEIDTSGRQTYEVQTGDTLIEIAIRFQVPLDQLAELNNIQDVDHIEVGTILVIPSP
jgi:LysM repeat protein